MLTFDDGYKDDVTQALPLLRRYHDKATFYLISGTIDSPAAPDVGGRTHLA